VGRRARRRILFDPLTYTTFGAKHALTGTGKALQKAGALKGWSGRAMLEGFHGAEPAMLQAGQTESDVTNVIDQGRRIRQAAEACRSSTDTARSVPSCTARPCTFGEPGHHGLASLSRPREAPWRARTGDRPGARSTPPARPVTAPDATTLPAGGKPPAPPSHPEGEGSSTVGCVTPGTDQRMSIRLGPGVRVHEPRVPSV
jgi:hypothetical protein